MISGRPGPWARRADDLRASLEALGHPGLVAAHRGRRPHPHGDVGDHAERALGADHQLAQRRAGGGVRGLQGRDLAGRGEQPHRADQRVEAAVAARGLAGRAGRGEAADRSRTRRTAGSGRGSGPARPSAASASGPRRPAPRRAVSERRSTSTSRRAPRSRLISAVVRAAQRLDPADDAGAAAEGDDRDALRRRRRRSPAAAPRRRPAPGPRRGRPSSAPLRSRARST